MAADSDLAALREANVQALLANNLEVSRQPLLSKYLSIKEGEQVLRRQFKSPAPGAPAQSNALRKRLLARKHFVPWGSSKPFVHPGGALLLPSSSQQQLDALALLPQPPAAAAAEEEEGLPPGIEPLVLWDPSADLAAAGGGGADGSAAAAAAGEHDGDAGGGQQQQQAVAAAPVVVDNMLTRFLRPHQREGVQFMFDCVCGLRLAGGQGCILADDMGLGKTLQGITLMWTLLQQGAAALGGVPIAKRAIIVCPTSLVSNWASECDKWLKGRCRTLPLCESSKEDVIDCINTFVHPPRHSPPAHCLIISYETFRLHAARLAVPGACDLLICDEAHRLKNDQTLTNRALDSLPCKRRVLLSGTPMQNHLDEFYAMVDFCNPGCLGSPAAFRKHFESPILAGREPGAAPEVAQLGEERSTELSALVNNFILRRTNKLLSDHLPPKVVLVVCCKLTPLQQALYEHFLISNATRRLLSGSKATGVLSAITCLKKLCNSPKLIYDMLHSKAQADGTVAEGFEGVGELMPPGLFDNGRPGRGEMSLGWEELSGKMALVARLLAVLRQTCDDKVVIVSNYTQTLDLFATLCRQRGYQFVRLDGSTSISKRQKLVQQLNAPGSQVFVFLLSSKAGGCGLNLVGANRLILFDPDWNPATDKQAAARVWRDGQKKRVYVYRLLSSGTIEEKVFQRQISKEGLQQVVDNAAAAGGGGGGGDGNSNGAAAASNNSLFGGGEDDEGGSGRKAAAGAGSSSSKGPNTSLMSAEELRQLFSLRADVASDTYEVIRGGAERAAAAAAAAVAVAGGGAGGNKQQKQQQRGKKQQQQRRGRRRAKGYVSDSESEGEDCNDDCSSSSDSEGGGGSDSMDIVCCSSGSGDEEEEEEQQRGGGAGTSAPGRPRAAVVAAAAAGMGAAAAADAVAALEADGDAADADADADTAAATQGIAALGMTDGYRPQIGAPSEEDLQHHAHHTAAAMATVPDEALRSAAAAGEPVVTFVFSCQVAGRLDMCQQQQPPPPQQQQQGVAQVQQQQQQRQAGLRLRAAAAAAGAAAGGPGSSSRLSLSTGLLGQRSGGGSGGLGMMPAGALGAGGGGGSSRKRFSAPAAVPSKRLLGVIDSAAAGADGGEGSAGGGGVAAAAAAGGGGGVRRHSTPAAAAAAAAPHQQQQQHGGGVSAALADASSRLNSTSGVAAGDAAASKRQKIQLTSNKPASGGAAAAVAAVAVDAAATAADASSDSWDDEDDDDDFM